MSNDALTLVEGTPKDAFGKSYLEKPLRTFVQRWGGKRGMSLSKVQRKLIIDGLRYNGVDVHDDNS